MKRHVEQLDTLLSRKSHEIEQHREACTIDTLETATVDADVTARTETALQLRMGIGSGRKA
jgi:hypothetical protein